MNVLTTIEINKNSENHGLGFVKAFLNSSNSSDQHFKEFQFKVKQSYLNFIESFNNAVTAVGNGMLVAGQSVAAFKTWEYFASKILIGNLNMAFASSVAKFIAPEACMTKIIGLGYNFTSFLSKTILNYPLTTFGISELATIAFSPEFLKNASIDTYKALNYASSSVKNTLGAFYNFFTGTGVLMAKKFLGHNLSGASSEDDALSKQKTSKLVEDEYIHIEYDNNDNLIDIPSEPNSITSISSELDNVITLATGQIIDTPAVH